MKLLIVEMVMILTLFSCIKDEFKDDELSIQRTNYTGNQLRIDGYYYEIGNDNYLYPEYFFYKNGTLIYIGGRYSPNTIDTELTDWLKQSSYLDYAKNNKLSGGVFIINGQSIKFEKWYPSSGGGIPAYVREGNIINDTTFVISVSYRMKKGKKTEVKARNETYHFKQFSPKPDSTNNFIK